MTTFQTLPIESIEHVFLFLESPKDLLHVALTCKEFHQLINATHRLHFHSVSCSPSETSSVFWEKLSTSQRSSSMFRFLELCDNSRFHQLSGIRQKPIFRIDEAFVEQWTGSELQLPPSPKAEASRSNFETFLAYFHKFTDCQSITILGRFSSEEYIDIFTYISNNLSHYLDTFIVKNLTRFVLSNGYVPRYTLETCTFIFLRTFYVDLDLYDNHLYPILEPLLDTIVFDSRTLVNFTLKLTCWDACFVYLPLMETADWPSLRKLEVGGRLQLFHSQDKTPNIYIEFLERHPQLECLRLEGLAYDIEPFQSQLPLNIMPQLRSLHTSFPVHTDILPRLQHISNLQIFDPETYSLARSLRSCTIYTDSESTTVIDDVVRSFPNLERLCIYFHKCTWRCSLNQCDCILSYNPKQITNLQNLTHFGMLAKNMKQEVMDDLLKFIITNIPKLSYIYLFNDIPRQYEIIRRSDDDGSYDLKRSEQPFYPYWCENIFDELLKSYS